MSAYLCAQNEGEDSTYIVGPACDLFVVWETKWETRGWIGPAILLIRRTRTNTAADDVVVGWCHL